MKKNITLIILMTVLTVGSSMFMMQCDNTEPGIPIEPGIFGPHPEYNEHMYTQVNYVYLDEETQEEVYQIALVLGKVYNAFDTHYENDENGALVMKSEIEKVWGDDAWGCGIILPSSHSATMSYYSDSYEGGVETFTEQRSFNLTSWDPEDMRVSMDELDPPFYAQVALNFDRVNCKNYDTGEAMTFYLTDTDDEAVLYKNSKALEYAMANENLITRYQ